MSGDQLNLDAVIEQRRTARHALDAMTIGWDESSRNKVAVSTALDDNLALVAEVRRLRAFAMEVQGVRGVLAKDADPDPVGQWERGHAAACRVYLDELDGALGMLAQ